MGIEREYEIVLRPESEGGFSVFAPELPSRHPGAVVAVDFVLQTLMDLPAVIQKVVDRIADGARATVDLAGADRRRPC